jgi:hypothetical protein
MVILTGRSKQAITTAMLYPVSSMWLWARLRATGLPDGVLDQTDADGEIGRGLRGPHDAHRDGQALFRAGNCILNFSGRPPRHPAAYQPADGAPSGATSRAGAVPLER